VTPTAGRLTREESQARTRADLLRAANRLFLRDGYAATSLAAIADEAGLTKGAVYSNFASKDDLFLAVLQQAAENAEWYSYAAGSRPSRRHVALFLEMNAAALRSDRVRKWVAEHNREFFQAVGGLTGLVAQSLYVGLLMHSAFDPDIDDATIEQAYELLATVAAHA